MRLPWERALKTPQVVAKEEPAAKASQKQSLWQLVRWTGPALMVSIAYMDPGNYGTDIAAGAGYGYALLWAGWLASGMAMLLQYLSGKLGIATGHSLPELLRISLKRNRYVIPYWLAAEAAAAATDLAEYLGTVIALNILFGVPLIFAAIFGALDVILLLVMMTKRFRLIEQYFALLISVLVVGILYNLFVVRPDLVQTTYGSVVPGAPVSIVPGATAAFAIVIGMIGATVMPHALFVHSWLTKNKMDMMGQKLNGSPTSRSMMDSMMSPDRTSHHHTLLEKLRMNGLHRRETIIALSVAGVVNAGILLVAVPLFQGYGVNAGLSVKDFVTEIGRAYAPLVGTLFALTLLASGLTSSALGTIAGQIIMEGLIGKRWNIWARRVVTRVVNVFPTTIAILLGFSPLLLLVYSQVILSLMIPLPMIPLVYYTSKTKFMGPLVNGRVTVALAILAAALILSFNAYYLLTL